MNERESLFEEHWAEATLAIILLVGTSIAWANRKITADTAEVIDVLTATLTVYVAILKYHFTKTATKISYHDRQLNSKSGEISSILEALSGNDFQHATVVVDSALERLRLIPQGILKLGPSSYYNELTTQLKRTKRGCHISAVSSMPIERWESDPRQINYFDENVRAVKAGVIITRVFIVDRSKMTGGYKEKVRETLLMQKNANISCYVVWRESIKNDSSLYEDFVLFAEANVVFTDEHEKLDPTRVLAGYLISNSQRVQKYQNIFRSLTETYCADSKSLTELLG